MAPNAAASNRVTVLCGGGRVIAFGLILTPALLAASRPCDTNPSVTVDADFPGGNIIVEKCEGDTVDLRQDLRDTPRDWFYWHIRVRGAQNRRLTFRFTRGDVFGPLGPAASLDGGRTWAWLGRAVIQDHSFAYTFPPGASDARFSFCIPYLDHNLREFLARYADNPHLKTQTLCQTRKGRTVESLLAGQLDGSCEHRVLLTARHHACESMANYVLEGMLIAVLADSDDGRWFRQHVEFLIVPFMDKDGVEDGDQGKCRKPHDHWEDYAGDSHYPEVRALRERIPAWSGGRLHVALDVHCPARNDQAITFAGPRLADAAEQLARFATDIEGMANRTFPFRATDILPFGKGWNTSAYFGERKCFMHWAEELPGVILTATLEVPYAQVGDKAVTAQSARLFGSDLARALRRFLAERR